MLKEKYIKNTSWLIVNRVVQMLIGLFINIFVTRYLGTTNYGVINYVNSYIVFFSTLCQLGLSDIIVNELVIHPNEQGEVLGSAIGIRFIASLISQVSFILLMLYIGKDDPMVFWVGIVQSFSLLFNSFDLINHWYLSKLMAKRNAIISFVAYITAAVYKIVLLVLKLNVVWFASAQILDIAVVALMLCIFYKVDKGDKLKFSFSTVKKLLKKSAPFILSGLMIVIYGQTDRIMLGNMLSVEAVGLYTLAINTITLWQFIPIALIDSARPIVFSKYDKNSDDWIRYLRYLYAGIIWLCIIYGIFIDLFGKFIIKLLYGDAFMGSVPVMQLSVWYMVFSYIGACKNIYLIAIGQQRYEKYFTLVSAILNICLNLALIPVMGIMGASLASLITQIFVNLIFPLLFKDTRRHCLIFFQALGFYGVLWGKGKLNLSEFKTMFQRKKKKPEVEENKEIENREEIKEIESVSDNNEEVAEIIEEKIVEEKVDVEEVRKNENLEDKNGDLGE